MMRNQQSNASSCCGWPAFCGACVAPRPWRQDCSRFKLNICVTMDRTAEWLRNPMTLFTHCFGQVSLDGVSHSAVSRIETVSDSAFSVVEFARCFLRLANLPNFALDRLSRYEANLWRQAGRILFALEALDRRKPQERARHCHSGGCPDSTSNALSGLRAFWPDR